VEDDEMNQRATLLPTGPLRLLGVLLLSATLFLACATVPLPPLETTDDAVEQDKGKGAPAQPDLGSCLWWRPGPIDNPVRSLAVMEAIVASEPRLPRGCADALLAKAQTQDFTTTRLYISHEIHQEQPYDLRVDEEVVVLLARPYCGGVRPRTSTTIIEVPIRPVPIRVDIQGDCGGEKRPMPRP
jgi:hypothetical protein